MVRELSPAVPTTVNLSPNLIAPVSTVVITTGAALSETHLYILNGVVTEALVTRLQA